MVSEEKAVRRGLWRRICPVLLCVAMLISVFPVFSAIDAEAAFPPYSVLDGAENIFLSYTANYGSSRSGLHSVSDYLPYVGYSDGNGKYLDYFMDTYLFLPCVTLFPSGGTTYRPRSYNGEKGAVFSDWKWYLDNNFQKGYNLDALNTAAKTVAQSLGDTDKKLKVIMSVLYPAKTVTDFGDVDGDGVSENFSRLADRKKAIKWMIDESTERFYKAGLNNLELIGFYWFEEDFDSSDSNEKSVFTYMTDYTRSCGFKSMWIPYYTANGYNRWKEFGFDFAAYQPNYMFNESATESRLTACSNAAKQLGMGVEIEAKGAVMSNDVYYNRYVAYLKNGIENGYMNTIKSYYLEGAPGILYYAAQSVNKSVRKLYDLTYKYAKGTLSEEDFDDEQSFARREDHTCVSLNKPYVATTPFTDLSEGFMEYKDVSGKELTDGIYADSELSTAWHGFHISQTDNGVFQIVIDLGSVVDNIDVFEIELGYFPAAAIGLPWSVKYYMSKTDGNYTYVGTAKISDTLTLTRFATYESSTLLSGRYVKAVLERGSYNFVFASEFAVYTKDNVTPPDETELIIKDGVMPALDTNSEFIHNIAPETTVAQLLASFENKYLIVLNSEEKIISGNDIVGTGSILRFYSNETTLKAEYPLIVNGDVDGDGKIGITDYLRVKQRFQKLYRFSILFEYAADINGDGIIDVTDYLRIKAHFQKIRHILD